MPSIRLQLDADLQQAYQAVAGPGYVPTPGEVLTIQCIRLLTILAQTRGGGTTVVSSSPPRPASAAGVSIDVGTSTSGENGLSAQQIRELVAVVRAPGLTADQTLEQLQREFEALISGVPMNPIADPNATSTTSAAAATIESPPISAAPETAVRPGRPG